jgi:tetratricopeptide (TPR) repeat protein
VQPPAGSGGIVEEIRFHTERAVPSSLLNVLDIIRGRDLGSTDFGRLMNAINVTLLITLYPAVQAVMPQFDPPAVHSYSRILREAERGIYVQPQQNSIDFLEHVLPFLAYYPAGRRETVRAEQYLSTLPDLRRAMRLNSESVLPGYFSGIANERAGRLEDAHALFSQTWELFPECYPAALGLVRVMEAQGRGQEALVLLSDLTSIFPDNFEVKRLLALTYYHAGNWSRAGAVVDEILNRDSQDGEFILIKAHILVEQGALLQAQAPLNMYTRINPNNRLYLFLRARIQAEAHNNRDAALNHLRAILRSSPDDEVLLYTARLLIESPRPVDQAEGRTLLTRLLAAPIPSLEVISLALEDAIQREVWEDAQIYLPRLLEERRSSRDLLAAYTVESGQGNNAAAFSYARELFERDRNDQEGTIAYISALIGMDRQGEAARMIESRLNGTERRELRSRYYYLLSQTRNNEEMKINDLQSSLFEDPRNLNALIALFEIYHHRNDERRASLYLRQALAMAPDNLRLKRFEAEACME